MKSLSRFSFALIFLSLFFLLSGCGKEDEELAVYKEEMTVFVNRVTDLVSSINAIDVNSPERTQELLACLDEMDAAFIDMAALEVPEEFSNVEELADEASSNLSKAVSYYHRAFDENYSDSIPREELLDAAHEYYARAFKRIDFIGTILQGELPDDESVTIVRETESEE